MTMLVTLTSIYVPLQLAFEEIMDSFDPEYFVLAFFWVDIVLTLRTTYFDEDTDEIIDPVIIARKYIKSWNFLIDVCSALPISEIITRTGAGKNIKWVVLTKSLRLLRINRLIKYLNDNSLKILYKILRYFFAFLLVVLIFFFLNTFFFPRFIGLPACGMPWHFPFTRVESQTIQIHGYLPISEPLLDLPKQPKIQYWL